MRDTTSEQQIHPLGLSGADDDYDYDVYYFWPSISPYVVSPEDLEAFDQLEGPAHHRWILYDDDVPQRPVSPVASLSYTTTTEFAFPEAEVEVGLAGYSRVFRSGFQHASRRLSRRLDIVLRSLQDGLRATKRKLRL